MAYKALHDAAHCFLALFSAAPCSSDTDLQAVPRTSRHILPLGSLLQQFPLPVMLPFIVHSANPLIFRSCSSNKISITLILTPCLIMKTTPHPLSPVLCYFYSQQHFPLLTSHIIYLYIYCSLTFPTNMKAPLIWNLYPVKSKSLEQSLAYDSRH